MTKLIRVPAAEAHAAVVAIAVRAGAPDAHAALLADNLLGADRRGIRTHGLARVPMYLTAIAGGSIDPVATPLLERGSPGASLWNARRAFGQVAMTALVDHACDQAHEVGAHVAVCHSSNHFGYAGHWALRAAERGLLGMAFTTGNAIVLPTGGVRPELGTNPLAVAIDGERDGFLLDMSTAVVALGKVEVAHRDGTGIPDGWAVDRDGRPVREPGPFLALIHGRDAGGVLPLGGAGTTHGGHKGYGLGMVVEILCAVLSGGTNVTPGHDVDARVSGFASHCAIVLDPAHLAGREATDVALDGMLDALRRSPAADPAAPVRVPGDPEREALTAAGDDVLLEPSVWADVTRRLEAG